MSRMTTQGMSPLQAPQKDEGAGARVGEKLEGYSRKGSARGSSSWLTRLSEANERSGGGRKGSLSLEMVGYVKGRGDRKISLFGQGKVAG